MRRRLVNRWAGWPAGDAANPRILITEGGVTQPYDCGLCDTFEAGGATRPAYRTWRALPSFQ